MPPDVLEPRARVEATGLALPMSLFADVLASPAARTPNRTHTLNKAAAPASRKKRRSDDDEGDDDGDSDGAPKGAKKSRKASTSGGGGGGGGFTKPVRLSPELAALVGAPTMSRPQLTKALFAYYKERALHDPADKRYIVCDPPLAAITGVERFQAFGVQKYLKPHILKD